MRSAASATFAVMLLLTSCILPTEPRLPSGATPWTPPAMLALWWRMTEACSGRSGDLRAVRWFVVPDVETFEVDGAQYNGFWFSEPDRIVLADGHRLDPLLVRHEMLHVLLGKAGHPRDPFLTACDGVVSCDGECATETGGRAPPSDDAPVLTPRDVAPRIEIVPRAPAASADGGAVALVVAITNPRNQPVWVRLVPQAPGDPVSHTFGFVTDYDDTGAVLTSGHTWVEGSRFPLGPSETRRFVWDETLSAGRYGIRGVFNTDTTARVVLTVGR